MVKRGETSVSVKSFVFAGNTLLTHQALTDALASYLNRPLNFTELQAAAAATTQAYRDAGWLVTAYLPKQEISSGVVTIQIVEAVFGKVRVQNPEPQRVPAQRLIQIFESQQASGQPLQADSVDRALLLLDDLPGVMVSGNLQAGESHSETNMALNALDEPLIKGDVNSDNYGALATGATRAGLNASLNSPLYLGDQLLLSSLHSQGSGYTRLAYSVPLGNDGWRAQVRGTRMNHHLIGDFSDTDGHGSARTKGAELSYPLLRSQASNLNVSVGYDAKKYENFDLNGLASRYETRASSVTVSGNHINNSGNTHAYGLTWVRGSVDLTDAPTAQYSGDANGAITAGRYDRFNLNLSRQQPLSTDTSVWLAYAAQFANRNLDSSEKFYLEGPTSVRAYGNGATALGGTEGQTVTAELRHNLDANWRLTEFYDYGRATTFLNNQKADGTGLNSTVNDYHIKGFGLTLGWQHIKGIDLKATVARRIGENPNPKSVDPKLDKDGTYRNPRYWLSASFAF
jgi:hemolysin activation/secretion protein